jgi:hypothetical protein
MIVQSAPPLQPHFVITQVDHARACGTLAAAFGNDAFAPLEPREPLLFLVAHHDEGWQKIDQSSTTDPRTHLPYHLTQTPIQRLIATGSLSPDVNEAFHPYSGLLSSMHTWGLYHGRYGLSDFVFIENFPAEHRPAVDAMLAHELARQERLKAVLMTNPQTAPLADETLIMHHYKLLQFFDTLGLYFHTTHPSLRATATFRNVPREIGDDVTITIEPLNDDTYTLSPFPFAGAVTFTTWGRWCHPMPEGGSVAEMLASLPLAEQTALLVARP